MGGCANNGTLSCREVAASNLSFVGDIIVVTDDCTALDATCQNGVGCVGNGARCTQQFPGPLGCGGDRLLTCLNGKEGGIDCTTLGGHCGPLNYSNPAGFQFGCVGPGGPGICSVPQNVGNCDGSNIDFCNDRGNQRLDCKSLGYRDCVDGHCTF
jgi:hypothetical protein